MLQGRFLKGDLSIPILFNPTRILFVVQLKAYIFKLNLIWIPSWFIDFSLLLLSVWGLGKIDILCYPMKCSMQLNLIMSQSIGISKCCGLHLEIYKEIQKKE